MRNAWVTTCIIANVETDVDGVTVYATALGARPTLDEPSITHVELVIQLDLDTPTAWAVGDTLRIAGHWRSAPYGEGQEQAPPD